MNKNVQLKRLRRMELIEFVSPYKFDGKHRGVRINLSFFK